MKLRSFAIFITGAMTLLACRDAGRAPIFSDAEVRQLMGGDTIGSTDATVEADTFAIEPEPLPHAVDELFDDFIFAFDQNTALQMERVRFPFHIDAIGNEADSIVNRQQWHHHHVFMHQDFYTVLWGSPREMLLADDIDVAQAAVEQIYLHSRNATSLDFQRDSTSGKWQLVAEQRRSFDEMSSSMMDFLDFYANFATDSIFQRRHVSNNLRFVSTDEDGEDEPIVGFIDVDQWFEFAPELPRDVLTNIRYGQDYSNLRRVIMQMRGISNGLEIQLSFVRDNGTWRLVGYEN